MSKTGFTSFEHGITAPMGFVAGAGSCGIKPSASSDLAILHSTAGPCSAGAVFTTNRFASPTIRYCKSIVNTGQVRSVVINSGNANAATGQQGMRDTIEMASITAKHLKVEQNEVLVASTGLIGVPLPMDKIANGIREISFSREAGLAAAQAILTTDKSPKHSSVEISLPAGNVRIGGMCKGAGMIHPNMATMLAFFTTDAHIETATLQSIISEISDQTFNMISVDGDSSTNDMTIVLANGASGVRLSSQDGSTQKFTRALSALAEYLAIEIVKGAEGSTRIFEVSVNGASSVKDARSIARSITSSTLMKTAVHGADPNFGRALCAIGYSQASFNPDVIDLWIGNTQVMKQGTPINFDESLASTHLGQSNSTLRLELHSGNYSATGWGCDLSAEYVSLNSEYST
tara:strand:- start:4459 stop:5670 length:1212 start_codon:yes stop_codon:yes gene_type:complete